MDFKKIGEAIKLQKSLNEIVKKNKQDQSSAKVIVVNGSNQKSKVGYKYFILYSLAFLIIFLLCFLVYFQINHSVARSDFVSIRDIDDTSNNKIKQNKPLVLSDATVTNNKLKEFNSAGVNIAKSSDLHARVTNNSYPSITRNNVSLSDPFVANAKDDRFSEIIESNMTALVRRLKLKDDQITKAKIILEERVRNMNHERFDKTLSDYDRERQMNETFALFIAKMSTVLTPEQLLIFNKMPIAHFNRFNRVSTGEVTPQRSMPGNGTNNTTESSANNLKLPDRNNNFTSNSRKPDLDVDKSSKSQITATKDNVLLFDPSNKLSNPINNLNFQNKLLDIKNKTSVNIHVYDLPQGNFVYRGTSYKADQFPTALDSVIDIGIFIYEEHQKALILFNNINSSIFDLSDLRLYEDILIAGVKNNRRAACLTDVINKLLSYSIVENRIHKSSITPDKRIVYGASKVDQIPVVVSNSQPEYPTELKQKNITGKATIAFTVDELGNVSDLDILESTEPKFGLSALIAVSKWRFRPGTKSYKPVSVRMQVPIVFELNEDNKSKSKPAKLQTVAGIPEIYETSKLDKIPIATKQIHPEYPVEMRRAAISCQVDVDFIVDTSGNVRNVFAAKSTRREFESAAIKAVSKWKFRPGEKNGQVVNTHMQVPIVFTVTNDE